MIKRIIIFLIVFLLQYRLSSGIVYAADDRISIIDNLISVSLSPSTESFAVNEIKSFDLNLNFLNANSSEKINYFKAEILFPKDFLSVPAGRYVDTTLSGFNRIIRVDGPIAANNSGKIIIELKAEPESTGPSMDRQINLAKIYFSAKKPTSSTQYLKSDKVKLVSNGKEIVLSEQNIDKTSFTVSGRAGQVSIQTEENRNQQDAVSASKESDFPELNYTTSTPVPSGIGVVIQNVFRIIFCNLLKVCK